MKGSFNAVAGVASDGKVELKNQIVRVVGDMAYEIGNEKGEFKISGKQVNVDQRVTNIYQKEGGSWKLVHHHADISPAMVEIVSSLQPGS